MSTQPYSMRRLEWIAGISLAIMVAAISLWRPLLQTTLSPASDLAAHRKPAASDQMLIANQFASGLPPTAEQPSNQDTTAILFLIDESGGVSGRCEAADTSSVFVTDQDGHRYELVRFYLQLWRAYYHFLQDEGRLDDEVRPIDIGIMQFARRDQPHMFLELTAIRDLILDEGANRFNQLQSQDVMLDGVGDDANWFCWTDFPSALDRAAEELSNTQAKKRVLVLLTDGSTRGNESMQESLITRSTARQSMEGALRRLRDSDIEVLTVIWRGDECENENDCDLVDNEFNQRKDDLARWKSWENAGLLTQIDDEQAIKALAETPSFLPLLPGAGQYATGWIDDTAGQPAPIFFSEVARLLKAEIITSMDVEPSDILFRPQSNNDDNPVDFARLDFERREPQWYLAEANIPGSSGSCPQRSLEASINKPVLAYYWLPTEQDWPKIKSISVEPKDLIIDRLDTGKIPEEERTITITVSLRPIDMNHYTCFQVQVEVAGKTYSEQLPRDGSELEFPPITLAEDLVYSQTPITATLAFTLEPGISAGAEKSTELRIVFQPIFPERIDLASVTETESLTVTVPITFAAQVSGFEPKFGLFPDEFDPDSASPPPATTPGPNRSPEEENCPATRPLESVLVSSSESAADLASQFIMNYAVTIPRHAIRRCGYKHLLVMWTDSDNKSHSWIDIVAKEEVDPPPPTTPWVVIAGVVLMIMIVFGVWRYLRTKS